MHRLSCGQVWFMWMAVLVLALTPLAGRADDKEDKKAENKKTRGEDVTFVTTDQVKLRGTFYAGNQGNKSPCVLLLHEIGGNRKCWNDLAKTLQDKGYTVLSFDFRAHNDSTAVDPAFFNFGFNQRVFRQPAARNEIALPDLMQHKEYWPMLVNDVAAARRYLDERNDAGDCNTSNLILIGAKEGAAIGSLWIVKEWQRPSLILSPQGIWMQNPKKKFEGEDVACTVWLSMPEQLSNIPITSWLRGGTPGFREAVVRDRVPMAFIFGEKDAKAKKAAETIHKQMAMGANAKDFAHTALNKKEKTKLAGAELLSEKDLEVEKEICAYLENVMDKRGNLAYNKREMEKNPLFQPVQLRPYFLLP